MKQPEQSTKNRIMDAALDLFCVDGYTTVSIRDIGKAVGIKESSIYYHFKNKEDILHSLFDQSEQWTQIRKVQFIQALDAASRIECEKFVFAGVAYMEGYLLEGKINKLIRMLTIEKQRSSKAAEIYRQLLFTVPLEHHKHVFTRMRDKGFMEGDDPELLAAEYQSMILYVFHKYFSGPGLAEDEERTAARIELSELLRRFFAQHICKEE
ncbi:TetR family transcriptional regulator [Fontibacillus phaseoli]|uniref:TetR family transcriptional regulator n=1 Tax=Fontibacillus phaseoli TaxID=1416533 RepID=A0A369BM02_9BACL|nr:TetR/AcrR family transcriptional regulator [Fontibacillus phaseoli]RCX20724.1 TetR family transcriptional regulator [Fontibacillus phaseoli]